MDMKSTRRLPDVLLSSDLKSIRHLSDIVSSIDLKSTRHLSDVVPSIDLKSTRHLLDVVSSIDVVPSIDLKSTRRLLDVVPSIDLKSGQPVHLRALSEPCISSGSRNTASYVTSSYFVLIHLREFPCTWSPTHVSQQFLGWNMILRHL
jgi:hypothetical protein